jgi:hypothetical protein
LASRSAVRTDSPHAYWGSKSSQDVAERAKELSSIATWLKEWARDPDTWDQNLICLGHFNIDRRGSSLKRRSDDYSMPVWPEVTQAGTDPKS